MWIGISDTLWDYKQWNTVMDQRTDLLRPIVASGVIWTEDLSDGSVSGFLLDLRLSLEHQEAGERNVDSTREKSSI